MVGCVVSLLHAILPVLQLAFVQFVGAEFGLLDEEEDVGVVGLLDDALELVGTDAVAALASAEVAITPSAILMSGSRDDLLPIFTSKVR